MRPLLEDRCMMTYELDRIRLYQQRTIDAELLRYIHTETGMQLLEHEDAVARRTILHAFGKTQTFEVRVPETWWQHVKLALRVKWPRLFRRLRVRQRVARFESGAVFTDIPPEVRAKRYVIPYVLPESRRSEIN